VGRTDVVPQYLYQYPFPSRIASIQITVLQIIQRKPIFSAESSLKFIEGSRTKNRTELDKFLESDKQLVVDARFPKHSSTSIYLLFDLFKAIYASIPVTTAALLRE